MGLPIDPSMLMNTMAQGQQPQANDPNDPVVKMFLNSMAGSAPMPMSPTQPSPTPAGPALPMHTSPVASTTPAAPVKSVAVGNPAANSQPGLFKRMLMDFTYGGAQALKKQLGMPTDQELQAQAQAEKDKQRQMAMAQQNQASEIALRTAQTAKANAEATAGKDYTKQDPYTDLVTTGGMKPQDALATINNLKLPVTPKTETELYMAAAKGDPAKALAMQSADKIRNAQAMRDPALREMQMQNIQDKRVDNSYKYHSSAIDKMQQPLDAMTQRFARLQSTLDQNSPQADALVAPELLTIMAGGQGSGLRMNEAEIARIIGGRSQWESLKAAAQKWSTDPAAANSITPSQRQQIRQLTRAAGSELTRQQGMIGIARQQLAGSEDVNQHKQIYTNLRNSFATPPQKAFDAQDPLGLR